MEHFDDALHCGWIIEPTFGFEYDVFYYFGCVHTRTHTCKIRNADQLKFWIGFKGGLVFKCGRGKKIMK